MGTGECNSCRSGIVRGDCILLALRMAPSLAALAVGSGFLVEAFPIARRAAICSGVGDPSIAGVRGFPTDLLGGGESWLLVNLPILSLTEPTSGPGSEPVPWRSISAFRFTVLATAATAAADDWVFMMVEGREC